LLTLLLCLPACYTCYRLCPLLLPSRLTQIFAVSQSYLYHAYAWLKLFNFSRSYNKNLTASDTQMMATSVVLATLSILPYDRQLFGRVDEPSHEQEKERTIRMANILGFSVVRGRCKLC
jgi:translation initiation factor 3 subunit A